MGQQAGPQKCGWEMRLNSGLRAALTPTATQSNFDTFMADILDVSAPSFMME